MNTKMKKLARRTVVVCGCALLLTWSMGCQSDSSAPKPANVHGEAFTSPDQKASPAKFADAQAASGARADATFRNAHFDGENLNSLGMAKLDMMLADDDACTPMKVYLDLVSDDPFKSARQDSVVRYMKDKGLTEEQLQFVLGPNPKTNHSAAQDIANLKKTDSTSSGSMLSEVDSSASGSAGEPTK